MGVSLLFPTEQNTWESRNSQEFNPEFPVDIRVTPANTTSGSFVLFLAGPPRLIHRYISPASRDIEIVLYPFAYTDNLGIGNSKSQTRIFGLGSTESLTVGGPSVGSIGFSRIIANTESLLAVAYKYYYYNLDEPHRKGFYYKDWRPPENVNTTDTSVELGNAPEPAPTDKATKPAGKLLLGLHQKIFNLPIGFAVLMYDQQYTLFSAFYLEEAVIRAHQLQIATATTIEQGSFEFARMVPFPEAENINPFDHDAGPIVIT